VKTAKILCVLCIVGVFAGVSTAQISLIPDNNNPDPNEEVTVYVHTDTPLVCMGLGIYIIGDANITSAMCEADCNQYGWDNGWNSDPYIDPNGYIFIGGVRWAGDANGTVGYFKFRYNSWQVRVYLDSADSCAFGWDHNEVAISTDILSFGQPAPNAYNEPNEPNITPPPNHWVQAYLGREPNSANFPDSNTAEIPDRSQWQQQLLLERSSESEEMQLDDAESTVVEVYSDITTNQIWTANNTYHINDNINVQALLVIEPGTVISFSYDGSLIVNNGGTLISSGTPDNPIIYTSDAYSGWQDYYCAIEVQETASPATRITYSSIDCAFIGIMTKNIRLDTPIQNNHLLYNNRGIFEYGTKHTDILNNLIYGGYNYDYYSYAIEVFMESETATADANSFILIENNTCYYQDYGITVHGTEDEEDMSTPVLLNNIMSGSAEIGITLADGWLNYIVSNNGYYGNYADRNWEFQEYDPVTATTYPFDESGFHLVSGCPFINAGLEYVEQTQLIGMTTDVDGIPDSNKIDIGYHYSNWHYGENYLVWYWDFDQSGEIGFGDLAVIANYWLEYFNFQDFAGFASQWRQTEQQLTPEVQLNFDQDVNSLNGYVQISVNVFDPNIYRMFLLMDGEKFVEVDLESFAAGIHTNSFLNGNHSLKILRVEIDGIVKCSDPYDVNFNNPVHCLTVSDTYDPNVPLRLMGFSATENNLQVKLSKWDGETIWSQEITDSNIDVNIPGSVLTRQVYDISIEQQTNSEISLMASSNSSETVWKKAITAVYDHNIQYRFAIFIPSAWGWNPPPIEWVPHNSVGTRKRAVTAMVNYCDNAGIKYIVLYGDNCTWDKFVKVLANPTVCYAYVVSRGASSLSYHANQRTYFKVSDGYVVSNLNSPIGDGWDNRSDVHSMASLGYGGTNKFQFVWIDVCLNGFFNDMANAWIKNESAAYGALFVSWAGLIQYDDDSDFCSWTKFFWDDSDGWGTGGIHSYFQAYNRALIEVHDGSWIGGKAGNYGNINNFHFVSH